MVRWALLLADGSIRKGAGPETGASNLFGAAKACAVLAPGLPPLYVAGGIPLEWDVERDFLSSSYERRWWILDPGPDRRLWLWPDGAMIGLGPTLESVLEVAEVFNGHDQRA